MINSDWLLEGFSDAINNVIQSWLQAHPRIAWAVHHPIWDLVIVFVIIFLFWGLFKAIGNLSEWIWIKVFQAPFRVIQFLFQWSVGVLRRAPGAAPVNAEETPQERLVTLLAQLEQMRQEQDKILQEICTLVGVRGDRTHYHNQQSLGEKPTSPDQSESSVK
jgi:hypothetical protein